jgi:hypothetical protein
MHFVNKQHLAVPQISEDRGQITFDLKRRARSLLKSRTQFVGNNIRERSLAQPRRPVEQHMIQRLTPRFRCLNGNVKILFDLVLPDEFLQPLRPQLKLKRRIILDRSGGDEPVFQVRQIKIVFSGSH